MAYRQFFDALGKNVRFTEAWIVTSMPRGGLEIVQAVNPRGDTTKLYARELHIYDMGTWRAVIENKALRGGDCFAGTDGGFEKSEYFRRLLQPGKLRFMAAARLSAPVLEGYAGALHLYRTEELKDFSDADLQNLQQAAGQIDQIAAGARAQRTQHTCAVRPSWMRRPTSRQMIVDSNLRSLLPEEAHAMEDRVADQVMEDARRRLKKVEGAIVAERWPVADSEGELWTFHVSVCPQYPALGEGPFIFYCLQPDCCDWLALRGMDFAADAELNRLIPAMHFMQEHYGRRPTLGQVAKTVHLSPFHFHRRFTELLGITPKHFLLEWQICRAKHLLAEGNDDLVDIARICGFAHQSHFTSRFKQATGLTPTRWRKFAAQLGKARGNDGDGDGKSPEPGASTL